MLKLTLKPGEYINIGTDIRIVFSGGSANNIHLLLDAPREIPIARNRAQNDGGKTSYYTDRRISEEAQREIAGIIRRERHRQDAAR